MPCATATIEAPTDDNGGNGGNGGNGDLGIIKYWNNLSDTQKVMAGAGVLAGIGFIAIPKGDGTRRPVRYTNRTLEKDKE